MPPWSGSSSPTRWWTTRASTGSARSSTATLPELLVLADSVAGVERMAARLAGRRRRLPVLVDIGMVGGRTGVRTPDEADAVAAAIEAADPLELAGLSVYEGVVSGETLAERQDAVRAMTAATREIADRLAPRFARSAAPRS